MNTNQVNNVKVFMFCKKMQYKTNLCTPFVIFLTATLKVAYKFPSNLAHKT